MTDALADLAQLRVEIIDIQRGPASLVSRDFSSGGASTRALGAVSLGGIIGGDSIIDPITESIERVNTDDKNTSMYKDLLATIFAREQFVRPEFRKRCGCTLKGSLPLPVIDGAGELSEYSRYKSVINPSSDADILGSPNFYNNVMLGDSITRLGGNWNVYTPGFGIINGGVSSATSQDVSEWLDFCASQNAEIWSRPHIQEPGCTNGLGHGGRFACNPPPGYSGSQVAFNSDTVVDGGRYNGYVQFQNRNVYLMIGGNDFNIELYRSQMQTLPVLIPFRHMHVANQVNKIISYIQY